VAPGIHALSQGMGRSLKLWGLRGSRALGLVPTTVGTALTAIAVLLAHRLQAGRGRGSWLAARPLEERPPRPPTLARAAAVRPAA
jgi:hypothetical protein